MQRPRLSILTCVITLLVLTTLTCGVIGYSHVVTRLPDGVSSPGGFGRFLDYLYLSMLLLTLSGRNTYNDTWLMVARWTGALFAFTTLIKFAIPTLEGKLRQAYLRLRGGHTLVLGLGEKGRCFMRNLSVQGVRCIGVDRRVVARSELDDGRPGRRIVWRRIHVQAGDAAVPKVLISAGLLRARRVIIVTHDDLTNLEIARQVVTEIMRLPRPRLDVIVHLSEQSLRLGALSALPVVNGVAVRPFSLPALAARRLLWRWPFPVQARLQGAGGSHLVFIGFTAYAEEVLLLVLRMAALPDQRPPRITILDIAPAEVERRLQRNYPALVALTCAVPRLLPMYNGADLLPQELLDIEPESEQAVTAVIVTAATDTAAICIARRLRSQTQRGSLWRAPMFVHTERPAEFDEVFVPASSTRHLQDVLEPFGDIESLCSLQGLQDWHERLAQQLHIRYVGRRDPQRQQPAARDWREVSEDYREANRRAVDHFPMLLSAAGYIVRGEPPVPVSQLQFNAVQLQTLARLEHDSWSAERRLAGWQYGSPRNDPARLHDCLVPYEQLHGLESLDIAQVRDIGTELQQLGEQRGESPNIFHERVIGLVGHSLIDAGQAERIARAVSEVLMQELYCQQRLGEQSDEYWTFVSALAPGSDWTLVRSVLSMLKAQLPQPLQRYRLLVVSPGDSEQMAQSYLQRQPADHCSIDGELQLAQLPAGVMRVGALAQHREQFLQNSAACDWDIPCVAAGRATSGVVTGADYDACGRYLLANCNELVAVLDTERYGVTQFDPQTWRQLPAERCHPHSTAALVRNWLQTPRTTHARALPPLLPEGLRILRP